MISPENELVARFKVFDDTEMLAEWLYGHAHREDLIDVHTEQGYAAQKYNLMEARENLLGLYDLCRSFVAAQKRRERNVAHEHDKTEDG